jgi:hypothetical protein
MASRCCGNRLSLRNQYDTKTPRASLSLGGPGRPWSARRLSRSTLETYSRHESNAHRAFRYPQKFSKISREENFPEKFLRSARPRDSVLRTPGRVIANVTSARTRRKPSASTGSFPALGAIGRFGPAMSAASSQKPRQFGAFAQALQSMQQIACEFAGKAVQKNFGKISTQRNATGSVAHLSKWARQFL